MADEFPDNGVIGNGLVINGFHDLQHVQEIPCHRIFCCIPGNLLQERAGIFLENSQFIDQGGIEHDVRFFAEGEDVLFFSIPDLAPVLDGHHGTGTGNPAPSAAAAAYP